MLHKLSFETSSLSNLINTFDDLFRHTCHQFPIWKKFFIYFPQQINHWHIAYKPITKLSYLNDLLGHWIYFCIFSLVMLYILGLWLNHFFVLNFKLTFKVTLTRFCLRPFGTKLVDRLMFDLVHLAVWFLGTRALAKMLDLEVIQRAVKTRQVYNLFQGFMLHLLD